MINGVESLKVDGGEEEEVKQPRVTKAQKRRVSYWVFFKQNTSQSVLQPFCYTEIQYEQSMMKNECLIKRMILNY